MGRYRKKPIVIEAHRWFQNGDHPDDEHVRGFIDEGKVVRRYRTPSLDGPSRCKQCNYLMHDHGWIETHEGGHVVCPGDWIIKDIRAEKDHHGFYYPCKPDIFKKTYEPI